jgi:hypothetical protein
MNAACAGHSSTLLPSGKVLNASPACAYNCCIRVRGDVSLSSGTKLGPYEITNSTRL